MSVQFYTRSFGLPNTYGTQYFEVVCELCQRLKAVLCCFEPFCTELHVTSVTQCSITVRVVQGGSNMTGTDLCVNKPHCAAAVRP